MEQKFCRECGAEMIDRVAVNRAILRECPLFWTNIQDNHDSYFTGTYEPAKFDPITGEQYAGK